MIEDRFAGRRPPWDLAGATFVDDVTPFEHLKMRVLNAAQSTLAYLGVLAGHEHTFDAVADPLLEAFTRAHARRRKHPDPRPGPRHRPRSPTSTQSLARLAQHAPSATAATRSPPTARRSSRSA